MNKKTLLSLFHIVTKSYPNKSRHLTQRSTRLFAHSLRSLLHKNSLQPLCKCAQR